LSNQYLYREFAYYQNVFFKMKILLKIFESLRLIRVCWLASVLCLTLFSGNLFAQEPPVPENAESGDVYRLGPGDVIDVVVARNETLSRAGVRIDNEGKIQLPMLDESIQAACLTERELAAVVKEKYLYYLKKPHVYVAVKEFNARSVAFIGAVNAPGRFQLQRQIRLLELLTFVNGPSSSAGRTIQIIRNPNVGYCEGKTLVRKAAVQEEVNFFPLEDTLQAKETANPLVQSGDVIRIVEAEQAYIIGNVKNSSVINLNEQVTLTQALAQAGGLLPDSDVTKIRIQRQTAGSLSKTEEVVNLKEITKKSKPDILLQPNDIVEVPAVGGSKRFFKDIIRTIVPSIVGLPTRVLN
jgi:polysaccharide biosynthesis/export protein